MNILRFNQSIQELATKYNLQDREVTNIFVTTTEKILNSQLILTNINDQISFKKIIPNGSPKNVNLTDNLIKKVMNELGNELISANKRNNITYAKETLQKGKIIHIEILKKDEDYFLCNSIVGICHLPFSNIAPVDFDNFLVGNKYYASIYSYSYSKSEIIVNCKSNIVDLHKIRALLLGYEITKVNRYYGVRVKIYINKIPEKAIISNLKLFFPKEKVIFVKKKKVLDVQ